MGYFRKNPRIRHKQRNIGTVKNPYFIWEDEIPQILNDIDITRKINLYIRSKKWGLPLPGTWLEQPAWIIELFDALDNAEVTYGQRNPDS